MCAGAAPERTGYGRLEPQLQGQVRESTREGEGYCVWYLRVFGRVRASGEVARDVTG